MTYSVLPPMAELGSFIVGSLFGSKEGVTSFYGCCGGTDFGCEGGLGGVAAD